MAALRIGVIGASYAAATHIPTFAALPETEVVAIATAHRDTARAAARRFGVPYACEGYEELCRRPDVDVVDVVTRPRLHHAMARAALAAGKHVLCEVPLALDVAEGEAMAAAGEKVGRVAAAGMQSRFSPGLWHLRRLVRDGWLGTVENVHATAFYPTFTRPERVESSLWCADADNGASSLRVHGLHTADLIRWVFGEVAEVAGTAATRRGTWTVPSGRLPATSADSSAFLLRLDNGAVCAVHTSWVAWHGGGWRLEAYGSEGCLVATAAGHTGHFPVTVSGARAGDTAMRTLAPEPETYDVGEVAPDAANYPLARLVRRLARAVRGGAEPDLPRFADAVAMLRLAEAVENGRVGFRVPRCL